MLGSVMSPDHQWPPVVLHDAVQAVGGAVALQPPRRLPDLPLRCAVGQADLGQVERLYFHLTRGNRHRRTSLALHALRHLSMGCIIAERPNVQRSYEYYVLKALMITSKYTRNSDTISTSGRTGRGSLLIQCPSSNCVRTK